MRFFQEWREHHCFSYHFKYLSISPSFCTSLVFLYIWKTDQWGFSNLSFSMSIKKKKKGTIECLKIKERCIQTKIRSSIFMLNSNAIWRDPCSRH